MASWRKMYTWRINCSPRFANIWHHEPDDSALTAFARYTVMRLTKREMEHKVGLREQGTSDKKGTKKGTCSNRSQSPLSPAGRLVTACVTAQGACLALFFLFKMAAECLNEMLWLSTTAEPPLSWPYTGIYCNCAMEKNPSALSRQSPSRLRCGLDDVTL